MYLLLKRRWDFSRVPRAPARASATVFKSRHHWMQSAGDLFLYDHDDRPFCPLLSIIAATGRSLFNIAARNESAALGGIRSMKGSQSI